MSEVLFTEQHEWIRPEDDTVAVVGITDYAQEQLGELVYVELPEAGAEYSRGAQLAVIESVKAASELYAPVSLRVLEVNGQVADDPSVVNGDPLGEGWFVKVEIEDPAELEGLMDARAYEAFVAELD